VHVNNVRNEKIVNFVLIRDGGSRSTLPDCAQHCGLEQLGKVVSESILTYSFPSAACSRMDIPVNVQVSLLSGLLHGLLIPKRFLSLITISSSALNSGYDGWSGSYW